MRKEKFVEEAPSNVDADGVQVMSNLTPDGRFELPDPVPMSPPIGYTPPPDIVQLIRSMVRNEQYMQKLAAEGYETFEEADDFDIEDDPLDPLTEYEKVFEPPPGASVGVDGGSTVKPTAEAAPGSVSKPVVSGDQPAPVAKSDAVVNTVDKSGTGNGSRQG